MYIHDKENIEISQKENLDNDNQEISPTDIRATKSKRIGLSYNEANSSNESLLLSSSEALEELAEKAQQVKKNLADVLKRRAQEKAKQEGPDMPDIISYDKCQNTTQTESTRGHSLLRGLKMAIFEQQPISDPAANYVRKPRCISQTVSLSTFASLRLRPHR